MGKGTIRRLIADRGFGFIQTEEGKDLFFHRNELQGVQFTTLREGQEVEFDMGQGRDGRPQAVRVRLTETQAGDVGGDDSGDVGGDDSGDVGGDDSGDVGD